MSDDTQQNAPTGTQDNGNGSSAAGNGSTPSAGSGAGQSIDGFSAEAQDYIKRLRSEAASTRNDLKEIKKQLEERENESKTEQQRKDEALTAAQRTADEAGLKLLRFEVAADKELPLKMADRLKGSTKEELEADAETLKKDFGLTGEGGQVPANGSGFDGGVRKPVVKPNSMNEMIRQAAGRT